MSDELFRADLEALVRRLNPGIKARAVLEGLVLKLTMLHRKGIVKINHSAMEIVVANYLLKRGYGYVDVEHPIGRDLNCDVYGIKGDGSIIVEVETGFTPPENSLDPIGYLTARIASKVARYGAYAEKFSLAIPPYYVPPLPSLFLQPPRERSEDDVERLKELLDRYYSKPPITVEEIRNSRVHSIMLVNVDLGLVEELGPEEYAKKLICVYEGYINSYILIPHQKS